LPRRLYIISHHTSLNSLVRDLWPTLYYIPYSTNGVTISSEKFILQREKEHCAIFICVHFMWDLRQNFWV